MAEEMDLHDAVVRLTDPDGKEFEFHYGAIIPYEGHDYVVLVEMEAAADGQEQLLITRLVEENGALSFVVEDNEEIVGAVFGQYTMMSQSGEVVASDECGCGHCHDEHDGCGCDHCHHEDEPSE